MPSAIETPAAGPRLLITFREAARILSVSEKTLWTLTKRGAIPAVRVGVRNVRYSVAALERWIEEQEPTAKQIDNRT